MRLLHSAARTNAAFDAENVVSLAGLVPVMRLAQEAGLPDLVDGEHPFSWAKTTDEVEIAYSM